MANEKRAVREAGRTCREWLVHRTAFWTSLFGFGERLVCSFVVVLSLVEKLVRRRRPSVFASEDKCEGEDVPTGRERHQRTTPGKFPFSFFLDLFGVCVCVVRPCPTK